MSTSRVRFQADAGNVVATQRKMTRASKDTTRAYKEQAQATDTLAQRAEKVNKSYAGLESRYRSLGQHARRAFQAALRGNKDLGQPLARHAEMMRGLNLLYDRSAINFQEWGHAALQSHKAAQQGIMQTNIAMGMVGKSIDKNKEKQKAATDKSVMRGIASYASAYMSVYQAISLVNRALEEKKQFEEEALTDSERIAKAQVAILGAVGLDPVAGRKVEGAAMGLGKEMLIAPDVFLREYQEAFQATTGGDVKKRISQTSEAMKIAGEIFRIDEDVIGEFGGAMLDFQRVVPEYGAGLSAAKLAAALSQSRAVEMGKMKEFVPALQAGIKASAIMQAQEGAEFSAAEEADFTAALMAHLTQETGDVDVETSKTLIGRFSKVLLRHARGYGSVSERFQAILDGMPALDRETGLPKRDEFGNEIPLNKFIDSEKLGGRSAHGTALLGLLTARHGEEAFRDTYEYIQGIRKGMTPEEMKNMMQTFTPDIEMSVIAEQRKARIAYADREAGRHFDARYREMLYGRGGEAGLVQRAMPFDALPEMEGQPLGYGFTKNHPAAVLARYISKALTRFAYGARFEQASSQDDPLAAAEAAENILDDVAETSTRSEAVSAIRGMSEDMKAMRRVLERNQGVPPVRDESK